MGDFDPTRHLRRLRGKGGDADYLDVKWRIVWLRHEHPDASIRTEKMAGGMEANYAEFMAWVSFPGGGSATGYGSETKADFGDFIEKAETKALGRAIAALGYGTQFVGNELDEGERIVDSPVERPPAPPAFDFAAWSADLATQAADGSSTGAIAARINQLKDDLTDEQYEAVMLWFRQVKDARKAGRAAPAGPSGGNPAPQPLVRLTDEGALTLAVDEGLSNDARADAARAFLDKATDAERLFARVAQLTVLDFPQPILDVLVEEQRERLGLPDDDAGEVAATPARPTWVGDDSLDKVPF